VLASSRTCTHCARGIYKGGQAASTRTPTATLNEIPLSHVPQGTRLGTRWGLIALDAPHMPQRFQNKLDLGSIHGCSTPKQNILKPNGSTFTASRGDDSSYPHKNFRRST